ncbi:MAG: threonine dehydratase [Pseudomonadota bacterium]
MFTKTELEEATAFVHRSMPPTPQYAWPTLCQRIGAEVWVKHENHTCTGAFKVRGALTFMDWLVRTQPDVPGIITATRGNHGQGQAMAATARGLRAVVYVPRGNSVEKNAAMRAFGAELVEFGDDFDIARVEAFRVGAEEGLAPVPPFHPELVRGVASYGYELMTTVPDLDTIYVPIGCGSGICSLISVRDALNLKTKIVGVVSDGAPAVKLTFEAGRMIETDQAKTFADGVATRVPMADAFAIYGPGAERIVSVSDDAIAEAIRVLYADTHNLSEGAGAAPLAALMQEKEQMAGRKVAVILCGGNIDRDWFHTILGGQTPQV